MLARSTVPADFTLSSHSGLETPPPRLLQLLLLPLQLLSFQEPRLQAFLLRMDLSPSIRPTFCLPHFCVIFRPSGSVFSQAPCWCFSSAARVQSSWWDLWAPCFHAFVLLALTVATLGVFSSGWFHALTYWFAEDLAAPLRLPAAHFTLSHTSCFTQWLVMSSLTWMPFFSGLITPFLYTFQEVSPCPSEEGGRCLPFSQNSLCRSLLLKNYNYLLALLSLTRLDTPGRWRYDI